MRPLAITAAATVAGFVLTAGPPALGAGKKPPLPPAVVAVAEVGQTAQRTMPGAVWRKLVAAYLGAPVAAVEDGSALPDDARCRGAHAAYAVLATFDRAVRLPGFAQDTDRVYGVARFTVRNCQTGVVAPTKTVRVESEPLTGAARGEDDAVAATAMWQRAVQASFAHDPLVLAPTPSPAPRR